MTNQKFAGKVAIITGASSGIGAAILYKLLELQVKVFAIDINKLKKTDTLLTFFEGDVTDEVSLSQTFKSICSQDSKIDFLFINAGIVPEWSSSQNTVATIWDKVLAVNVKGAALTLKYGIACLKKPGGTVVVTGSINSWKGDANLAPYVASKHAVYGIVKSAALELGKSGIRVNGIAPGPIATDALLSRIKSRNPDLNSVELLDEFLENLGKQTTLGRIATINDVVNGALFLASEQSASTNGHLLPIDGGIL